MSGRVVHFEMPFDDADRVREFYTRAFGWQTMVMPEFDYTIVMSGPTDQEQGPTEAGFINGGLMQRKKPFEAPNIVIGVDNLETALSAVNDAGGSTVLERMPVGDMGAVAYFRDTEDNLVGLWESAIPT